MPESTVLVTGANGFIGTALCPYLQRTGWSVRAVTRRPPPEKSDTLEWLQVASLNDLDEAHPGWDHVDAVIHLAGLAHAPHLNKADAAKAFAADAEITRKLAEAAASRSVGRFVFVSTAKVYDTDGVPVPEDPYACEKHRAEGMLANRAEKTGMAWVVVRPVLVYGPGVKGNLARLSERLAQGVPLPLGGLQNQRSLIALEDLTALLEHCLRAPGAVGQVLPVAASDAISTTEICVALASGLGVTPRLPALPGWCWSLLRHVPGLGGTVERLTESFVVDPAPTIRQTGWKPHVPTHEGLAALGRSCRKN